MENLRLRVEKPRRVAFRDRNVGKLATVVCRSRLITCFANAALGIVLMRIACTRVKNFDILWRRLSFNLSVAAKSRYRERRLLFSSLGCD